MLIFAAGLTCFAYLFNRLTKTENAEKPFYFGKFLAVLKYSALAVLVIVSGIIFYMTSGSNFLFFIVGSIIGGFLAFLFVNLIIYKSIREVFKGLKQFLILVACASVFAGLISADVFGIDKHIPAVSRVRSISYSQWNYSFSYDFSYEIRGLVWPGDLARGYTVNNIVIKDPEAIQLVNDIFTAALKSEPAVYVHNANYFSQYAYDMHPLRSDFGAINYNLRNGITWAKKLNIYELLFNNAEDLREFDDALDKLRENHEYKHAFYYPLTDMEAMREQLDHCDRFNVTLSSGDSYSPIFSKEIMRGQMEALIIVLNKDIANMSMIHNNNIWQYDMTLTFRNADNHTGYINIAMNDRLFAETIHFIFNYLD